MNERLIEKFSRRRMRTIFEKASRHARHAICLFALIISGCQRKESDHLVLLSPGGATRKAVETAVAQFQQENPGLKVKIITTPGKDYYVKSLTMLVGQVPVDVLWMGQGFGMFAGRNALLDLTPYLASDPLPGDTRAEVVDWYRRGEKLYGIPYGIDVQAIAYNKDWFDAAGVPYPKADWTVDEMLAIARELTDRRNDQHPFKSGLGLKDLDYRYFGLSLLDADERHFALNTPTGVEWLKKNVALVHDEKLIPAGADTDTIDRLNGFLSQQTAMIDIYSWDISELRQRAPFQWDIVAVATGRSGKRAAWASSAAFCIARSSKHPDASWKLLRHLTGAAFQRSTMQQTVPTLASLHDEYRSAHPAPPEHLSELLRMLDSMQGNPRTAAFAEIDAEWKYWKKKAILRQVTAEEALNQAESNINRILSLHRKEEKE